MIRRRIGDEWLLFTQDDHAKLAAEMAERFGNASFDKPHPRKPVLTGVAMHDAGWPLHDDEQPTLNAKGEPLDVFEVPRAIALRVWSESATRASAVHPYAGLLTSIHVLSLSIYATQQTQMKHESFDTHDTRERFAVNQFQHEQIELQETLRAGLGLHTDIPLKGGLAEQSPDPLEQKLAFDLCLLQAMDQISLAICCTEPPALQTRAVYTHPGARPQPLDLQRENDHRLAINPWPFDVTGFVAQIPFKRLAAKAFTNPAEFHAAYRSAEHGTFEVELSAR